MLGKDYSGAIINNYYFPVDTVPDTSPEHWNYYDNPGADASWNDKSKYKYIEQLEYMKDTRLMFNDISSRDNCDNPSLIKQYNITARQIGLSRARLDTCSTWKTNGIIHVKRKVGSRIRYAVFLTSPMAANAKVQAVLNPNVDKVHIKSKEDEVKVVIDFGTKMENMTGYAKKEHIKEVSSKLYINGKKVKEISGSKTINVGNRFEFIVSREDSNIVNNVINIKVDSYAHTEFAVDGLMTASKTYILPVEIDKKEIIPVKNLEIKELQKENNCLVVSPLAQKLNDANKSTKGITEAGRKVVIKLLLGTKSSDIKNIRVYLNNEEIKNHEIVLKDKSFGIKFEIPVNTISTIYGWKSLRENLGNYFNINEKDIGERISLPHLLVVKYQYDNQEKIETLEFDTIDDYISNLNYSMKNKNLIREYNNISKLEDWLSE